MGDLIMAVLCLVALVLAGLYGLIWVLIFWIFPGIGARWFLLRTKLAGGELCITWPGSRVQDKLWGLQKERRFRRGDFTMQSYTPRGGDDYTLVIRLR
jgi:hypothetical protein